jgi:hypothetical protein
MSTPIGTLGLWLLIWALAGLVFVAVYWTVRTLYLRWHPTGTVTEDRLFARMGAVPYPYLGCPICHSIHERRAGALLASHQRRDHTAGVRW